MTDLDTLRRAMRADDVRCAADLDLPTIMAEGRRLRIRRRLAYGFGGMLSAATVAAVALSALGGPAGHPVAPLAATPRRGTVSPVQTAPATPSPGVTAPATPSPGVSPVGRPVRTGLIVGGSARVLFFTAVDLPETPTVTIGINAGRLDAGGVLRSDSMVNDVRGFDRSPGFHQIGYDQSGDPAAAGAVPTFGYFVGPAVAIVGVAAGRKSTARIASWSVDSKVKIFWFDPAALRPGLPLDGITAYDHDGHRL